MLLPLVLAPKTTDFTLYLHSNQLNSCYMSHMSNVLQLTNMQKDHWLQIVLSFYTTHPDQRRQCRHPATRVHCYISRHTQAFATLYPCIQLLHHTLHQLLHASRSLYSHCISAVSNYCKCPLLYHYTPCICVNPTTAIS